MLHEHGSSLAGVPQLTVYLLDIFGDFDTYGAVYRERMLPFATPARTTVQVARFRGAKRIEQHAIVRTAQRQLGGIVLPVTAGTCHGD